MSKNIKETLLSTLVHGEETLENIKVLRKVSKDNITTENQADKYIDRLHAKELKLVINEIIDTKKDAKIFRLTSENGYLPPFEAGQYINIFVEIDGVRVSRPYSLSSSPRQRSYYEITIADIKDGFVSTYMCNNAKVGDHISSTSPSGVFRYQPVYHSKKSLFLAGGSGITPFLSMTREILDANQDRDVVMLYGVNDENKALYDEEFSNYAKNHPNFKYHLVVSGKDSQYKGERGFIDAKLIERLVPDYSERTAYICGPQIMNSFCDKELRSLGLKNKNIRREMFGATKNITEEAGWPSELSGNEVFNITIGDKVIPARANESILVALERTKVRVNVCCRSGECSLCRVKLVDGKVYLSKGVLLRKADEKFGYIHSCKAYPISDVTISL